MDKINNAEVAKVFENYPKEMRQKLLDLRQLILDTAAETKGAEPLEETLKWGEPSYLSPTGSTIRIDWKKSKPKQYAMYFNCKTKLLDTFKEIYGGELNYEGNRAIVFQQNGAFEEKTLKHCIALSLKYHKIKHLPLLGA